MGGCFEQRTFGTVEALLVYVEEQIKKANEEGLYLLMGEIKQVPSSEGSFEWRAYFSK